MMNDLNFENFLNKIPNEFLLGRRVLITGAARGLGLAFAQSIAQAGAEVIMADILQEQLNEQVNLLRSKGFLAKAVMVDLRDKKSIQKCALEAGNIDGLINNAAITNSGGVNAEELDIETWDRVMEVNVRGTWLMSCACRKALISSKRGAIVNLASDTALWGAPKLLAYVSSKGAVISMTRSLAREWGNDGITVNAIAPGLTLVEATQYVPKDRHQQYFNGRALKREQLPFDVCGAVLYALSDLSRFVTGQLLATNGGYVMH